MKFKVNITAYWELEVEAQSLLEAEEIASKQVKLANATWEAKTECLEQTYFNTTALIELAAKGPITVQRFEGGWKIIEQEDQPNEKE